MKKKRNANDVLIDLARVFFVSFNESTRNGISVREKPTSQYKIVVLC